jgi:hypothetical protein
MDHDIATPTEMSSSAFVSYAVEASREASTWEDASKTFQGPPRWEVSERPNPRANTHDMANTTD